jgi:hypothetical protein
MVWVGVRYRGIALPDIMKVMRVWLDQRPYQPTSFDYVISGRGTLVRVQFNEDAEAAEFAEAFAGFVSPERPSAERWGGAEVNETSTERPSLGA